jgi:hypothetical protein
LSTDAGKILRLTDVSLITVEVPAGLGVGFTCDIIQGGTGQILLEPVSASGVTLFGGAPGTHLYTEGQHCQITLTIDNTGAVGYSTGQVSPLWVAPATAAYLTLSNMSGSSARFDDYSGTLSAGMGSYPSWGTYDYVEATVSQLAGKYLKYTIANNATMQTDIQTAFTATAGYGITGWMSSSPGSGSLYAVYNTHIELATTGPLYVYSGTGGTSPTTITDPTTSISFIPIIYGVDWNGSSGGPKWGMTFVYNESGYVEESYDVYGSYNSSMGQLYASNVFGSSSSTTQSAFSADGGDTDTSGSRSYTPTFTGDMA